MARIGIIGGSGLYHMDGVENIKSIKIETPFGSPSDAFITGALAGREVVFVPRHGKGHRLLPTEVNNRANIWALKSLGVESILSISAVGSLREDYQPADVVVIDQLVDRTNQARPQTFFGNGIVAHIQFSQPFCSHLRQVLLEAGKNAGASIKDGGAYVNMEGPQFSTLAESQLYRKWGMDVVGMTQMNEARLAREAEICYATLCLITDFDCWHEAETGETVSVEAILKVLEQNTATAQNIIRQAVPLIDHASDCPCANALDGSIITNPDIWPADTVKKLKPILEKYQKDTK